VKLSAYDRRTRDPRRILRNHLVRTVIDPFDAPPPPPSGQTRFVLFGVGRNGSSLLVDLLNTDPRVFCDEEIFMHWRWWPKRMLVERLGRGAAAYGFKLLSYQTTSILGYRRGRSLLDWLEAAGFRIIWIRRDNLFRHALSQINARQTRFHIREEGAPRERTHVALADIDAWIADIRRDLAFEEAALRDRPHLLLSYEDDLCGTEAQEGAARRVSAFLGLDVAFGASTYRKVVSEDLSRNFTNADEIAAHMVRLGFR
jgi:hypothetical protein